MPQVLPFPTSRRAPENDAVTLETLAAQYLDFLLARRKSSSLAGAKSAFRRPMIRALFHKPLAEITRRDLEDAHRADPHPVAANRCLQWLRAAWIYGEKRGLCPKDSNPLTGLSEFAAQEAPRGTIVPEARLRPLLEEISRQRATAGHAGPFQPDAVLLILLTGMRKGEIEALEWADVKPGRLELKTSKTGARMVPLSTDAEDILAVRRYRELGGKVFQGVDLRRTWDRIRKAVGLEKVTIHDLRRTFAVTLLSTGKCDLKDVAAVLGHASTRITAAVYTPLQVNRAKALAELAAGAILNKGEDDNPW
jgi:integrase